MQKIESRRGAGFALNRLRNLRTYPSAIFRFVNCIYTVFSRSSELEPDERCIRKLFILSANCIVFTQRSDEQYTAPLSVLFIGFSFLDRYSRFRRTFRIAFFQSKQNISLHPILRPLEKVLIRHEMNSYLVGWEFIRERFGVKYRKLSLIITNLSTQKCNFPNAILQN